MVFTHSNDGIYRYSFYSSKEQIGLIERDPHTVWGNDSYVGEFNDDSNKLLNILLILFIDATWHTEDVSTEISHESTKY